MLSLCSQLSEIAPVCGVLGNHEDELYFLNGDQALVEKFTAAGVTILRNQEARYTVRDNVISILGVEGSPAVADCSLAPAAAEAGYTAVAHSAVDHTEECSPCEKSFLSFFLFFECRIREHGGKHRRVRLF